MIEKIKIEMPIEKYLGLLRAGLLSECVVIETTTEDFDKDESWHSLHKESITAYKKLKEHEFELKKAQRII